MSCVDYKGRNERRNNIRIISTSSKFIREEVDKGNFREDLYHRLNVVPIFLPALKDRTEDIPSLLNYFSKKIAELNGINETKLDTDFDLYYKYDWPGNVRELRNMVERIDAYRNLIPKSARKESIGALQKGIDIIILTSASTATNLCSVLGKDIETLAGVTIVCLGQVTASAAQKLGLVVNLVAKEHNMESLLEVLEKHYGGMSR